MTPEFQAKFERRCRELVRDFQLSSEALTESQLAEAFKQAVICGDFIRQVRVTDHAQAVIYIPYAREQELEGRVRRLEKALAEHGIEDPDKLDLIL